MKQLLRKKAKEIALANAAQFPKNLDMLSLKETQLLLHELQVHQIELEMQNDELSRTKIELNAERERYFDLYDLAPVGYFTLTKEGLIVEANLTAATLLGIPRSALVKQSITDFVLEEDQDIYYLYRKKFFESCGQEACELRMIRNDGTLFWAHMVAVATQHCDTAQMVRLVRLVLSDITEQKRNELHRQEHNEAMAKVQMQERMLYLQARYVSVGEVTGNIAHQWKQPLIAMGAIQMNIKASLIFKGEIPKEKLLKSVETSFELLHHLSETIDTFYNFLTQQHNDDDTFMLADQLQAIRKLTEYSFENSGITLLFELHTNSEIQGNSNELTHAILNLILNAKEAFDDSQTDSAMITVRAMWADGICIITVSDNAGGIRMVPIDSIFDSHISSKENGSGIGLFMTKNIIENKFSGSITALNKNGGAHFRIEIPSKQQVPYFAKIAVTNEEKSFDHIKQLTNQVIKLAALEKRLQKWSDVFHHAKWGVIMYSTNTNTFELMNPAFAYMHGYSVEELTGHPIESVFTQHGKEYLEYISQNVGEQTHYTFESLHMRKDGSSFPVAIDITAITDEKNAIEYCIANVRDITSQKKADELLKLKTYAMDSMRESVYLVDENARFGYVNDETCRSLGYCREELLTMTIGDISLDWPNERWPEHWELIKERQTVTMEVRHRRKDGTIFPEEIIANYIEYEGVSYSIVLARNIKND